jgi:cytosine/adenosine deaminase-related metal-dependent hydrolase
VEDGFQIEIDGFVNAHDHSFQRALRDRVEDPRSALVAGCSDDVVVGR